MFEKTFTFWNRLVGNGPETVADGDGGTAVAEDRRLWVRYEADLRGNIQLPNEAKTLTQVRDLSVGGASLEVERRLELGQMLTLELPSGTDEIRSVLACVVRVIPQAEGKWAVGCVFSRELTGADLERFGARKEPSSEEDKRTWVRYHCELKAKYRKVGDPAPEARSADVLNISANGIGLSVNPALEAGSLLNVDLLDRHGKVVRTILACVVHTSERGDGDYAVGCNFIRELREEELESLLS